MKKAPTKTTTSAGMPAAAATVKDSAVGGPVNTTVGSDETNPVTPANVNTGHEVDTDEYHEAKGTAVCCLKGSILALHTAAAEVRQFKAALGAEFHEFARTRLGLTPAMAEFFVRLAVLGLDPERFSPAVEVKLPELLAVLGQVTGLYTDVASGMALGAPPGNGAVVTAENEPGSIDTSVIGRDERVAPPENAPAAAGTMEPAITDILSVMPAITSQKVLVDPGQAATDSQVTSCSEITVEQRRFIAERSVTLLLKVSKGELTPEAALRQAERLPKRKKVQA